MSTQGTRAFHITFHSNETLFVEVVYHCMFSCCDKNLLLFFWLKILSVIVYALQVYPPEKTGLEWVVKCTTNMKSFLETEDFFVKVKRGMEWKRGASGRRDMWTWVFGEEEPIGKQSLLSLVVMTIESKWLRWWSLSFPVSVRSVMQCAFMLSDMFTLTCPHRSPRRSTTQHLSSKLKVVHVFRLTNRKRWRPVLSPFVERHQTASLLWSVSLKGSQRWVVLKHALFSGTHSLHLKCLFRSSTHVVTLAGRSEKKKKTFSHHHLTTFGGEFPHYSNDSFPLSGQSLGPTSEPKTDNAKQVYIVLKEMDSLVSIFRIPSMAFQAFTRSIKTLWRKEWIEFLVIST